MIRVSYAKTAWFKILLLFLVLCFCCGCYAQHSQNKPEKLVHVKKDPTPLDMWKLSLLHSIEPNWIYTDELAKLDKNLKVIFILKILKNGYTEYIHYETKSGNTFLDESALEAIKKSIPFKQLPEGMESYKVAVIFTPKGLK